MKQKTYIAIDLKSFYASVECRERGLDPLDTNLVVADESRTDKTICLAVTPSLKSYGISGRGRLFEVKQRVKEANAGRRHDAPGRKLEGSSYLFSELQSKPELAIDFIIAPPRMAYYMEYSTRIYEVYMKYVAPEDIMVYSIDEVFMDVTDYLNTYKLSPHDLAIERLNEIKRLLCHKAEIAVCLTLQGGQIVELRRIDRLRFLADRRNDGLFFITSRRNGLCLFFGFDLFHVGYQTVPLNM